MRGSLMDRVRVRAALVGAATVLLTALTAVSTPPTAGAVDMSIEVFESDPLHIRRHGVRYRVAILARNFAGHPNLHISYLERTDPDGVVNGRRLAGYDHGTRFDANPSLSQATLDPTPTQMGGRGAVDMAWTPSAPASTECSGDKTSRPGALDGSFVFDTQTSALGKLKLDHIPGTLSRITGFGCDPPPGRCVHSGFYLQNFVGGSITGYRRDGESSLVAVFGSSGGSGWSVYQEVESQVPLSHVTLSANERSGELQGAPGSWFWGTSTFSSSHASETTDPTPCNGGRQWFTEFNDGHLSTGLHVNLLVGPNHSSGGEALVARTTLQDAP